MPSRTATCTAASGAAAAARRRGSAYVMIMGVATLVAVIGVGALLTARANTRMAGGANEAVEADALALSAVEQALALINSNPTWRTLYRSGEANGPCELGRGKITWAVSDEFDGDLANNANDVARLVGSATVGRATRVYAVQLKPAGPGLAVLGKATHASAAFSVRLSTATITATGGPLSTDGEFRNDGTVNADVEAASCSGGGFKASMTTGVRPRPMPSPSVFDLYLPRATEILWTKLSGSGSISGLLSAASNPYGAPNAAGIYHVRVPAGAVLKVDNARLKATLLVTAGSGARVQAGPAVLWEPPEAYMPSLIARGAGLTVSLDSSTTGVSELSAGQSLNAPGTPYNGSEDTDLLDTFPAQLCGLFHVIGGTSTIDLGPNLRTTGVLLTDGTIVAGDLAVPLVMSVTLAADPRLVEEPPDGYTTGEQMAPVDGTWERRPSP